MTRKKLTVDAKEFWRMVEKSATTKEIMARFGIKTKAKLDPCYIDVSDELGKAKPLGKTKELSVKELKVNSKGALVVPRRVMEAMKLTPGDLVDVRMDKSSLILKPKIVTRNDLDVSTSAIPDKPKSLDMLP